MTSDGRKFIDYSVLQDSANHIGTTAKAEGKKVALVGGFALQLYGSPRLTGDLDIVGRPLAGMPIDGEISFGGLKSHTNEGVPVDFIMRIDDYKLLYEEAALNTVSLPEVTIPVVRPEYIAAMKMAAGRLKDQADLEWMISEEKIDVGLTRNIIKGNLGIFASKEFWLFVEETRWKKGKGLL